MLTTWGNQPVMAEVSFENATYAILGALVNYPSHRNGTFVDPRFGSSDNIEMTGKGRFRKMKGTVITSFETMPPILRVSNNGGQATQVILCVPITDMASYSEWLGLKETDGIPQIDNANYDVVVNNLLRSGEVKHITQPK
jgi:hypothetical protein